MKAGVTGRRVLVIDDDRSVRSLARVTLEATGYTVAEAADAERGLESIAAIGPDVVLLDVMMPGMNGFEACAAIRTVPELENLPVIMMTGLEDLDSITRAYEAGATDFVTKPVNWELLKHRIRYTIRAAEAFSGLSYAQRIAHLGNWEWSADLGLISCSDEARRIFGVARETTGEAVASISRRIHPDDLERVERERSEALDNGGRYQVDYRMRGPEGTGYRFVHEQGEARAEAGGPPRLTGTIQDITERRRFQDKITYLALHDTLTGLPNRRLFMENLEAAMARARARNSRLALLCFDIDRFKLVNDTYGHRTGDEVLRTVARRVQSYLRNDDVVGRLTLPTETLLSRLGGDEFVVVVSDIPERDDAVRIARRIQRCLRRFRVGSSEIALTASIGITHFPDDADTLETLMTNADVAMYEAKRAGRNTHQHFNADLDARMRERVSLERELGKACERGEMYLRYQPIYDLPARRLAGAEALLRWRNPRLGSVSPERFIPIAEDTGQIVSLGEWVLTTACRDASEWIEAGMEDFCLAVNVSAYQFRQPDFVPMIERVLGESGLAPRNLSLELTESVLMDDAEDAERVLEELQQLGVSVAIDDFGTGYSSLSYLRRFSPRTIKIDRSFMSEVMERTDAASLVSAIVSIAHDLGIEVVAEGVESAGQLEFLLQRGCEKAQGYLLGSPAAAEAILELVHRRRHPALAQQAGGLPAA